MPPVRRDYDVRSVERAEVLRLADAYARAIDHERARLAERGATE